MLPGETIGEILLNIVKIYLILSFLLTCYSVIRMYVIRHRATAVKYGKERIQQLIEQGRFRQLPLYTMDEISQKKSLGEVRLSIFPNDTGERRKYVIVCPGRRDIPSRQRSMRWDIRLSCWSTAPVFTVAATPPCRILPGR